MHFSHTAEFTLHTMGELHFLNDSPTILRDMQEHALSGEKHLPARVQRCRRGTLFIDLQRMHEDLVEELHRYLYIRTTSKAIQKFRRQGSDRQSQTSIGLPSCKSAQSELPIAMSSNGMTELKSKCSVLLLHCLP